MTRLESARRPDVEGAARQVLVVPLGSLEQHGPHLPLATDAIVAAAVAERLHELRPDAGLAPLLPLGASGEHAGFAGTLSIGTAALRLLLLELVRDASAWWHAVLVVNGHGGNADALRAAREECAHEGRLLRVVHLGVPGADAHAGRAETSLLLHLAPHLVDLDRAEAGVVEPLDRILPRLTTEGVRAVSPNGVLGDPAGASAEEGRALLDVLVAKAVAAHDALLTAPSPP